MFIRAAISSSVTTTEISHDALCPNQQQISACSSVMRMFCPAHCIRRYEVSCLVFNSVALSPGYRSTFTFYIYIYAFSRRFYPKRSAFRLYIFLSVCNACFNFLIIKYVLIGCFVCLFLCFLLCTFHSNIDSYVYDMYLIKHLYYYILKDLFLIFLTLLWQDRSELIGSEVGKREGGAGSGEKREGGAGSGKRGGGGRIGKERGGGRIGKERGGRIGKERGGRIGKERGGRIGGKERGGGRIGKERGGAGSGKRGGAGSGKREGGGRIGKERGGGRIGKERGGRIGKERGGGGRIGKGPRVGIRTRDARSTMALYVSANIFMY